GETATDCNGHINCQRVEALRRSFIRCVTRQGGRNMRRFLSALAAVAALGAAATFAPTAAANTSYSVAIGTPGFAFGYSNGYPNGGYAAYGPPPYSYYYAPAPYYYDNGPYYYGPNVAFYGYYRPHYYHHHHHYYRHY